VIARRCAVLVLLGGSLLVAPALARAQPAGRVARIGFISPASASDPRMQGLLEALRQGLRDLGYVEGRNLAIEPRWADEHYDRLPGLAADLVARRVDVIVAVAVPAIRAAKEATRTIPIVMAAVVDPVATGLVASLARPGGNVTGLSTVGPEITAKQVEMLKQIVPRAALVAVLWNPANPGNRPQLSAAESASRALGMRLQSLEARTPADFDPAFAAMIRQRADALIVLADVMLNDNRSRLVELAAANRLPTVYGQDAGGGGLLSYSANTRDLFRRSAGYVDRILKGARPGDLPVEQANTFELVINLKVARALGLTVPPSLLHRADRVIE
jgi:putative tryptophan/tyrosine transport system substrate-binding protein